MMRNFNKTVSFGLRETFLIFAVLFCVVILIIYASVPGRVYKEDVDSFIGMSHEAKREYFMSKFPTKEQILSYVRNSTIVISHPPLNVVAYFAADNSYYEWSGRAVEKGFWYVIDTRAELSFDGKRRTLDAYSFCHYPEGLEDHSDACAFVRSEKTILLVVNGHLDYEKGDVFGLYNKKVPPFPLPASDISMQDLRSKTAGRAK